MFEKHKKKRFVFTKSLRPNLYWSPCTPQYSVFNLIYWENTYAQYRECTNNFPPCPCSEMNIGIRSVLFPSFYSWWNLCGDGRWRRHRFRLVGWAESLFSPVLFSFNISVSKTGSGSDLWLFYLHQSLPKHHLQLSIVPTMCCLYTELCTYH